MNPPCSTAFSPSSARIATSTPGPTSRFRPPRSSGCVPSKSKPRPAPRGRICSPPTAPEARWSLVTERAAGSRRLTWSRQATRGEGFTVALVEQPYRVAGRRSPASAKRLDEAWVAVLERLRGNELEALPLIVGGRSLGARVACRTLDQTGAEAVLCLAFPLKPPGRGNRPPQSRLPELEAVEVPVLVVQGESDRFGMPPEGPKRRVVKVAGDHGLKADTQAVAETVAAWLGALRI